MTITLLPFPSIADLISLTHPDPSVASLSVDARCATDGCGGYLVRFAGRWFHAVACVECVHDADVLASCPDDREHAGRCDSPQPELCSRAGCHRAEDLGAWPDGREGNHCGLHD